MNIEKKIELVQQNIGLYEKFIIELYKLLENNRGEKKGGKEEDKKLLESLENFFLMNKKTKEVLALEISHPREQEAQINKIMDKIKKLIENDSNRVESFNLLLVLIQFLIKEKNELEALIKCGLYVFNIGKMQIKSDVKEDKIQDMSEFLRLLDEKSFNDLERYFFCTTHKVIEKWLHYFEVYDRHFSKYRNTPVVILEIGVFKGGSLQMWKNYFGKDCRVIGIDIDPECKKYEEEQIEIYIGSQEERKFWQELKEVIPKVDILIDDGGHTMNQQIITFEEMFQHVKDGGVYLCEDLHTSYWSYYGGGYKNPNSFIEYSKNLIDAVNAWHSVQHDLDIDYRTLSTHSIHYYNSVMVIEKEKMRPPIAIGIGEES